MGSPHPGTNFTLAPHHHRCASASLRPSSFVGREHYYHGRCARDTRRSGDDTLQEGPRRVSETQESDAGTQGHTPARTHEWADHNMQVT